MALISCLNLTWSQHLNRLNFVMVKKTSAQLFSDIVKPCINETLLNKKQWKVLFYGSDEFSLECLKLLHISMSTSITPVVQELQVVCSKPKTKV